MEKEIFNSEFLNKLEKLYLKIKMASDEGNLGFRKSRAKGGTMEFSDYREYAEGDDFRKIDWNAYGRFDKLFLKLFMEEKETLVNIFIDISKSMDFGENKKSKKALELAATLTFLSITNSDRVCINTLSEMGIDSSRTLTSRKNFNYFLKFLDSLTFHGTTNINSDIKKKQFHSKGISIIISDFLTEENIEESLKYLCYKKQEFILIHILDKEEISPVLNGHIKLKDSETNEYRNITVTYDLLYSYKNTLKKFISNLQNMCKNKGGKYVMISSDDSLEEIVFHKLASILEGV